MAVNGVDRVAVTSVVQAEVVVVGGGSSGAVVAGRLAEAGRDVLLVEAGPDFGPLAGGRWPPELLSATAIATTHDWGYASGRWTFERARVIGGCSAHNGAIAAVGHRSDYDGWGLPGWSSGDIEPFLAAALARMRVRPYQPSEAGPFHARCLDAARSAGWPIASDLCDLDTGVSFGLETVNVVGSTRWNTAFAYLDPVRSSGHLRILDETLVDRLEPRDGTVCVLAERRGEAVQVETGLLVLAAGVYGTPAILQRSGIGDPARLRAAGSEPTTPLPGVGANLHDHPMVHADRRVGSELQSRLDAAAATGFLPEEQTLGKARSSHCADGPYDLHLYPVCASNQTSLVHGRVLIEVACLTPASRGRVDIASPDPRRQPIIDHRYLSDPPGHDLGVLRDGLALANELFAQPALRSILGGAITDCSTDDAIRANVVHYYHPVGSCAMGTDPDAGAVCDPSGRVFGVDGVVLADCSIMPRIPRANTNIPAVMVGERIAALLSVG